jgi:hypothetical protein
MRPVSRWSCAAIIAVTGIVTLNAEAIPVPIPDRVHGAARVVVATVDQVTPRYETNRYGDKLIISHAQIRIEEALKGSTAGASVAVEGGTVDGITMRVSDMPTINPGDRAVFFLSQAPNGEFTPYLRGQGIVKLDATNHVRGSSLTLDDIRRMAAEGR